MPFAAFPLLLSTAAAVFASTPLPPPPPSAGGCTLHTSLNKIHWVDEETLRGTDKPVRWKNESTGAEIVTAADEGGYISQSIPADWVQAVQRGRVSQKDGSRDKSRAIRGYCMSCDDGRLLGACVGKSVKLQSLRAVDEAAQ